MNDSLRRALARSADLRPETDVDGKATDKVAALALCAIATTLEQLLTVLKAGTPGMPEHAETVRPAAKAATPKRSKQEERDLPRLSSDI